MKERMKKLLTCMGAVGVLTVAMAVPAMAETQREDQNIDKPELQEAMQGDTSDWSDKAAANVTTYANIRQGSDISTDRVGKLSAGAVVTVVGEENGWMEVVSGDVEGYIRGDLLVTGDAARQLFEASYGEGAQLVGAEAVDEAAWRQQKPRLLLKLPLRLSRQQPLYHRGFRSDGGDHRM